MSVLEGRQGKAVTYLAALLLHSKAFPCQCKARKFLFERGDLEMEKL